MLLLPTLLACWPLYLLLLLPRLGQSLALLIANRVRGTLDHRIPDELPLTAGEWLAKRLAAFGHGVAAIVTDKTGDAYRPFDRVIQLNAQTHFKADPVYWSTAAHEFGHAYIRFELPWIARLRIAGQYICVPLLAAGVAMLLGHILYTIPLANSLAFACFAAAAITRITVLVDEGVASLVAYRELRTSSALDPRHLRAVRWVLMTSFATYFATYAGYALLLSQWHVIHSGAPIPHDLTHAGWVVVAMLSIACIAAAVIRLVDMFAPNEVAPFAKALAWIPIVVLVWMTWDYRVDTLYAWCVIAALAASWRVWNHVAVFSTIIPEIAIDRLLKRFSGPGLEQSSRYKQTLRKGAKAISQGNARLDLLANHWKQNPPWPARLTALSVLGYLPLLVAIWL